VADRRIRALCHAAVSRREWRDLRTDALRYDEEPMYRSPGRHQILLNGVAQDPSAHVDDVVQGFEDAHRCLAARRADLTSPNGRLAAFARGSARVTLRPTNHAMLSVVLADRATSAVHRAQHRHRLHAASPA
jgi:hypothetical protein